MATNNTRINTLTPLIKPKITQEKISPDPAIQSLVTETRMHIHEILQHADDRLVVIVGPCSIHDTAAALDYAQRLAKAQQTHAQDLCILMRVYFEKPRTTVGWKGLINDPNLDNSFDIEKGLHLARQLLVDINALGLPVATEFLDTIIPQYIADLVSWAAIGARTTESQVHRELASGLSMPVGFKNTTSGDINIAVDAVFAASHPHHFLGVSQDGNAAIVSTKGNPDCHVILRGGKASGPNYHADTVDKTAHHLHERHLSDRIMVDCSHGNSQKDHTKQAAIIDDVCQQIRSSAALFGVMIESNIQAGSQPLTHDHALEYGKSITDACVDWQTTEKLLDQLALAVQARRQAHDT